MKFVMSDDVCVHTSLEVVHMLSSAGLTSPGICGYLLAECDSPRLYGIWRHRIFSSRAVVVHVCRLDMQDSMFSYVA